MDSQEEVDIEMKINIKINSFLSSYKPFLKFLSKRLGFWILVFIVGLNLVYFLPRLMPVNPVDMFLIRVLGGGGVGLGMAGASGASSGGRIEEIKARFMELFGLDKPPTAQYLLFWRRIFTLNFGISYVEYPKSVSQVVLNALTWTLLLVIPAIIVGFILGTYLGLWVSLSPSKIKNALFYIFVIWLQTPYYWIAMILLYAFAVTFRIFPIKGAYSERFLVPTLSWDFIIDALWHYILPFLTLCIPPIGGYAAGMRAAVASEARSLYVEFCNYLGFSRKKLRSYILRSAILPQLTWFPITFVGLLSQTLLVEVVFGYPGLGFYMYLAAFTLDYPLMEALFLMTMSIIVFGSLIIEIIYGILNPKIGATYVAEG
jgi:peptide/nickel transport system permease protein